MNRLEERLRATRASGRKILVPYLTGGLPGWTDGVRAAAANGADVIEIGLPFSDPVMDGPVIQEASQRALDSGANPVSILDEARSLDVEVPLVVMCYYNTVHHPGAERFASMLASAGMWGVIGCDRARSTTRGVGAVVPSRRCSRPRDDHVGRTDRTR
jgi:tryptophan synthase alpha chain